MQKYGTNPELDKLVDSYYLDNRKKAARRGYGLDKLINDESSSVRIAVAEQGYGLNILINDEDWQVRKACVKSETGFVNNAWPEFCANNWETLMHHEDVVVRAAVAERGYGLDILITDEDNDVRAAVAEQGYGLDKLIKDEDWWVRIEIAKHGYGLDKLINDENYNVRAEVARQRYGLDKLINDEDWYVRAAVARQGYGLDILINDEDRSVREAVARQGYGLDILINDESLHVREDVKQYLKEHNYKSINDWAKQNPDKVYGEIDIQLANDLKDFIYKIDESFKLEIQTNCDNIDNFFIEAVQDILVIQTVDTKEPIIKIEKTILDQKVSYKFIVDITNKDGEIFIIKTFIKSREQLDKTLHQTIEYLSQCPAFSKYVADLENCL